MNNYLLVLKANPMTPVITATRAMFFGGDLDWPGLAYAAGFALVLFAIGLAVFQRVERSFADVV